MKCPKCVEQNLKSRVYPNGTFTTCIGWFAYYDEEGKYHSHDPNIRTTTYSCSEGHKWKTEVKIPCASCPEGE